MLVMCTRSLSCVQQHHVCEECLKRLYMHSPYIHRPYTHIPCTHRPYKQSTDSRTLHTQRLHAKTFLRTYPRSTDLHAHRQTIHAGTGRICSSRPYVKDRLRTKQVMDMSNTMVQHDYLSAVTLPRPRAAVRATVLRSVFSDAASRKVITARAWSRLLHLATRGPAGCTMHS